MCDMVFQAQTKVGPSTWYCESVANWYCESAVGSSYNPSHPREEQKEGPLYFVWRVLPPTGEALPWLGHDIP